MVTPTLRRPNAPILVPVLIINDHHYPAIHAYNPNNTVDDSSSRRPSRPRTPPSHTALRANRSPGLPVPSPLCAGGLPSPVLALSSASSSSSSSPLSSS